MRLLDDAVRAALASEARASAPAAGSELTLLELGADLDVESLLLGAPLGVPGDALEERLFSVFSLWDPRLSEIQSAEVTLGLGVGVRLSVQGEARFERVQAELGRQLRRVRGPASKLRAFGGFSFDDRGVEREDGAREVALFTVPRWTLTAQADGRVSVLLLVPREELEAPAALLAEAELIQRLSDRAPTSTSLRRRRRAARVVADGAVPFARTVAAALARIEQGDCDKIVVARALRVAPVAPPAEALLGLRGTAGCVRFALGRPGATFLGVTPETLVVRDARGVRTEALAGTEPRTGADLAEAMRLLVRDKDRREHAIVVEAVAGMLRALELEPRAAAEPRLRTLTHVHHLVTPIEASCPDDLHVLRLVEALHPTPALGGSPRRAALSFLAAYEDRPRGLYAAPIGWFDGAGRGAFVVGIRSAELRGGEATVWAGCGIVKGSLPELELAETEAKAAGMLAALGVAAKPPVVEEASP